MYHSKSVKCYLEKISFEISISFDIEGDNRCVFFDFSTALCLCWVCSTILASETHDNEISKVRYTDFAHPCFTHHRTSKARHIENCCFIVHKVVFLKRFCEVYFLAKFFRLNIFFLLLSILLTIAHLSELFHGSFEMCDLTVFVLLGGKRVLDVWVSAWISYFNSQGKLLPVEIHLHLIKKDLKFFVAFRFMNFSKGLMKFEFIIHSE